MDSIDVSRIDIAQGEIIELRFKCVKGKDCSKCIFRRGSDICRKFSCASILRFDNIGIHFEVIDL